MRLTLSISRVLSIAALASFAGATTIPGASTPLFYLVSSSSDQSANLLPVRTVGGAGGYSTLSGSGSIGQFYFFQGNLVALDSTQSSTVRGNIGAIPVSSGCSTYGQLGFSASSSDNCAVFDTFNIQSNAEDSQLGAQLVFNFAGGFYACGSGQDVWYQADATDGPPGLQCSPINLYTVPV